MPKHYYSRTNALCEKHEIREQEKEFDVCAFKPPTSTPTKWGCYLEQGDVDCTSKMRNKKWDRK